MRKIHYENNKNIVSEAIRAKRLALRLSQSELAARMQTFGCQIDQQMISKIEHNTRFVTDYELVLFAKALKTSPESLLENFIKSLEA